MSRKAVRIIITGVIMTCMTHFIWSAQSQGQRDESSRDSSVYEQVSGTWEGILQVMGVDNIIRFSIPEYYPEKPYRGILAIPQQIAVPLDIEVGVDVQSGTVSFTSEVIQVRYDAVVKDAGNMLSGTWYQAGMEIPLEIKRSQFENIMFLPRPQDPKEPYGYHADEVVFQNHDDGIQLAGTLTYPKKGGPFPAVILVTGSGTHNRDQELFGHRPFKVLADRLTHSGIAVLRYDDRGGGGSQGDPTMATSWDLSKDTEAAFDYLLTVDQVDPRSIGILGLSEGGMIAPMVADRREEVSFLVLMAAPGVPGDQLLISQSSAIMTAQGLPQEMIDANLSINRAVYDLLISALEGDELKKQLERVFREGGMPESEIESQIPMITLPWMRYFIRYDPSQVLSRMGIPVLVIQGDRDTQVDAQENVSAIQQALTSAGNTQYTSIIYPGLNHLLQPAATGLPSEYGIIDVTMDPGVMDDISRWILKKTLVRDDNEATACRDG